MALGRLGSAWSLKVAAVWTNLPVSHVTPSVSLGMWEDSAHPSSCHTVSVLSFLQKAFVSLLLERGWPPTLSIQSGWLYFFFFLNSKSRRLFSPLVQKGQLCLIISLLLLTCLFSKLIFSFLSLLPGTLLKRNRKSRWGLSYRPVIKLFKQLLPKMLFLTLDNESNPIGKAAQEKKEFKFAASEVNGIFKHALCVMKYL